MMIRVIILFLMLSCVIARKCNFGERDVVDNDGKKKCLDCALCGEGKQPAHCDMNITYEYPLNNSCMDCPKGYFNDQLNNAFLCRKCPTCSLSEKAICFKKIGLCVPLASPLPYTETRPLINSTMKLSTPSRTSKNYTTKTGTTKLYEDTTFATTTSPTIQLSTTRDSQPISYSAEKLGSSWEPLHYIAVMVVVAVVVIAIAAISCVAFQRIKYGRSNAITGGRNGNVVSQTGNNPATEETQLTGAQSRPNASTGGLNGNVVSQTGNNPATKETLLAFAQRHLNESRNFVSQPGNNPATEGTQFTGAQDGEEPRGDRDEESDQLII